MSGIKENNDRIYKVDDTLDIFVDHARGIYITIIAGANDKNRGR